MSETLSVYLLSIRGTLVSVVPEAARSVHNTTTGAPASVAAAKALGDLSHMVYTPLNPGASEPGAFLILDLWNNLDGINQFFANPHVQEQAGLIFAQRDPVVWQSAAGFFSYHLPAPSGQGTVAVGVVRGKLHPVEAGQAVHNELVAKFVNTARSRGNLSHDAYLRLAPPGTPEALEFCAVDTWMDVDMMAQHYQDPAFLSAFGPLFAEQPSASMWVHAAGEWVEW